MLKKLMITTAVSGLMIGSAIAQSSPPASPPASSPPAATTPAPAPDMKASAPSAGSTAVAPAASSSMQFVNSQKPDQWLASKFKGTDVLGSDNEKIGDVSDLLFDKAGKVEAVIISVGGFLGMGAKEVAIPPNQITVQPGSNANDPSDIKLKVAATKDQLKQAANFERYTAPRATTGAGGNMPARPAPASK